MSSLSDVSEKLKRADEHIEQLDLGIKRFMSEGPKATLIDVNTKSLEAFRRSHQDRVVPVPLRVIAGEVLYQLRSSLDHLASILILKDGGSLSDGSQFPIFRFEPTKKDEIRRYERQINGITRPEVLTLIEEAQPYTKGTDRDKHPLAVLKFLSNADKHRALVMHVVIVRPNFRFTVGPPTGTKGGHLTLGGQTFDVMNMQREITANVTFPKFGNSFTHFNAADGLRLLLHAVMYQVDVFTPWL